MHECFFPWSCKVVHIGASVWNRKVGAYTSNFSFIKPWVASGCNMLQYVAIVPISQLASPPIYEWLIWKSISSCCRFEKTAACFAGQRAAPCALLRWRGAAADHDSLWLNNCVDFPKPAEALRFSSSYFVTVPLNICKVRVSTNVSTPKWMVYGKTS